MCRFVQEEKPPPDVIDTLFRRKRFARDVKPSIMLDVTSTGQRKIITEMFLIYTTTF